MTLQITRVDTLDDATLDIELSNGHLILFSMESLLDKDPGYAALKGKIPLPRPVNDGISIHWRDGPRLGLDEILALLAKQDEEALGQLPPEGL